MTETERPRQEEEEKKPPLLKRFGRNFVTGLLVFLPLAILIFIVRLLVQTLTAVAKILFGFTESVEMTMIMFVSIVFVITYAGSKFARRERWTLNSLERAIVAIPLVGSWYETIKDLVGSFTGTGKTDAYLGVVQIPMGPGHLLGFVTRRDVEPDGRVMLSIFMPTAPNPTSGIVMFFYEDDITYVNISPEHAFKIIISLGLKR
ncbi:protein of unknown function DUF502 [Dethiosulfovibrio peptidovorans DSM 11002]|uniref:DUF502 domain-containing protein n=1 Tax=Dethiosulfovibrio peptidovorans DSM 11002 TaxID=469381 RepID=D2Z7D8_9BACT|nr:DUF502 domain-containing protein [Dethiosulfovibrio peptidovorans]EFC91385.1 protein of unknown function DUF502 [Dethiosulfovibrio peptidovorans DSM 11002]